jgi:hypothetical protein
VGLKVRGVILNLRDETIVKMVQKEVEREEILHMLVVLQLTIKSAGNGPDHLVNLSGM